MSFEWIERCISKISSIDAWTNRRQVLWIGDNKISGIKKNNYWSDNNLYFWTSSRYYKKIHWIKKVDDLFDDFFDVPMLNIVWEAQKEIKTKNKKNENIKKEKTTIWIEKRKEISSIDISKRWQRVSMY